MTLLELVVALALVGTLLALVIPSLAPPAARGGRVEEMLRAARGAAIARAQTLTLDVTATGAWRVLALPPGDTTAIVTGALDTPPSLAFRLQLSALGACLPATALPREFAGWDAAGCRPAVLAERPE